MDATARPDPRHMTQRLVARPPGPPQPYARHMTPYGHVSGSSPALSGVSFASWQQPGEQVLWTGRPDPRVVIPGAAVAGIVIGVILVGLGLFWERGGADSVVGLLPILAGAWLAVGRPIRDAHIRRRTTSLITDRRAVIMTASRMMDTPVLDQPAAVRRSRAGRVFADIGTPVPHYSRTSGPPGADGMPGPSSTRVRYVAPTAPRRWQAEPPCRQSAPSNLIVANGFAVKSPTLAGSSASAPASGGAEARRASSNGTPAW
jgi:hypothetical protein